MRNGLLLVVLVLACSHKGEGPAPNVCTPACRGGVLCAKVCTDGGTQTACVVQASKGGWARDDTGEPVVLCETF